MASADGASVADGVARFLAARGPKKIFGLSGGHIQPIWDGLARFGVRIVDVRHEGAAVHMATAHALLTGGVGMATVTAGPGATNCVTAISNAHRERAPVLVIGGCPPTPQDGMDALQGTPNVELMRPVTRLARTLRVPEQVLRELDFALACASGLSGPPGPVFVEIPTNILRQALPASAVLPEFFDPREPPLIYPDPDSISRAAELLAAASRPLVISGRGAAGAGEGLRALLEATGALYLDTRESRGVVPQDHSAAVSTARSEAIRDADLIMTVGCQLDFLEATGSAPVPKAALVRVARHAAELRDVRRGAVEVLADPGVALAALTAALRDRSLMIDTAWGQALRRSHRERWAKYLDSLDTAPSGTDGYMHPNRIFAALRRVVGPAAISIADGGEMPGLAQLGLSTSSYLDAGDSGCLGVGVPFANAASLAFPKREVVAICDDAAFGRHATELDTTARHGCRIVVVVANKGKSKVERQGQYLNFGDSPMSGDIMRSDYAAMAKAFGLNGERVVDPGDLVGALRRAFASPPALVDVWVTQDAARFAKN